VPKAAAASVILSDIFILLYREIAGIGHETGRLAQLLQPDASRVVYRVAGLHDCRPFFTPLALAGGAARMSPEDVRNDQCQKRRRSGPGMSGLPFEPD
jgi:hypothetical protein